MDYRTMPKTGLSLSTVGLGGAYLHEAPQGELESLFELALQAGINIVDMASDSMQPFPRVGQVLRGQRQRVNLALQLGMTFPAEGQYERTREAPKVLAAFESQLAALGTDYADIAYIHCVDELDDFQSVFSSGLFEQALALRRAGRIRALGAGTHNVDIARRFVETNELDVLLFSLNPAYDLDPVANNPLEEDLSALNSLKVASERSQLYRLAESMKVGLTVMKPFAAGRLLDARTSPFKQAMSIPQCLQYCLDRPAVLSCMVGVRSRAELAGVLEYYRSGPAERDYSFIAGLQHEEMRGKCVYCNHCLPCPGRINIAQVNKYLDLAEAGDSLAGQHYLGLAHRAGECVGCGSCERNCPFQVEVRARMRQARELFGL